MTNEQAKEILLRYRPGMVAANDAELAAALALCEGDPALRSWFEGHRRAQAAIQKIFRAITPPAGLKEQIISEHQAALRAAWWRHPRVLAVAALIILMAAVAVFWLQRDGDHPDEMSLAAYRTRMVRTALSPYTMEVESGDLAQVRGFLARQQFPSDFELPEPLTRAAVTGCATLRWQGTNVSMICFRTNQANPTGAKSDLWLFVMNETPMKDAPEPGQAKTAQVSRMFTVAWKQGGKIFLLGTEGDEAAVRKWL